jgi:ABC-type transport system involved in multi-copper enzyme maturation permease subunit
MSAGLIVGVRGIVGKEVRSRTRGFWRPMLQLTVYLGLLTLAVVAALGITVTSTGTISPNLGQSLFAALAIGSVLLIAFIAPALTVGTISGERERRTFDLLLVTRASPLGLATGKLAGALMWILYLLVASLPVLGIVNLFGGVSLLTAVATIAVLTATAVGYSALGLLLSSLLRRTVLATVLAYAVVLITVVVLPILNAALGFAGAISTPISSGGLTVGGPSSISTGAEFGVPPAGVWLQFVSPLNALTSAMGGVLNPFPVPGTGRVSLFSTYVARITTPGVQPQSVISLAPWLFYSGINFVLGLVYVLLAALAMHPVPVRRRRRTTTSGG